jgi:phosphoribosylamine--glycine ligase
VLVAPGNAGTAREDQVPQRRRRRDGHRGLLRWSSAKASRLTVVGPEAPLVAGVVDAFRAAGHRVFGPTAAAAQLEGSKAFAKDFLARHGFRPRITPCTPTSTKRWRYVREQGAPIVVKADGLAAGKGVIVAMTLAEAEPRSTDMLAGNAFGAPARAW